MQPCLNLVTHQQSDQNLLDQNNQFLVDQTQVTQNSGGDPNFIDQQIQVDSMPSLLSEPSEFQQQPTLIVDPVPNKIEQISQPQQQQQPTLIIDPSPIQTITINQRNPNINRIDQKQLLIDDRRLNLNNLRQDDWRFDDRRQNDQMRQYDYIRQNDKIDWRNNNIIDQRINQINQRSNMWDLNPQQQLFRQQNVQRIPTISNPKYDNNLAQHINRMQNVVYNSWRK